MHLNVYLWQQLNNSLIPLSYDLDNVHTASRSDPKNLPPHPSLDLIPYLVAGQYQSIWWSGLSLYGVELPDPHSHSITHTQDQLELRLMRSNNPLN